MIEDNFNNDMEGEVVKIIDRLASENKCYQTGVILDKYTGYNPPKTVRWLSPKDLVGLRGWSISTIRRYNRKLLETDLIKVTGSGSTRRYMITEKGLKFLKRFCWHCMNGRVVVKKEDKYTNILTCNNCGIKNHEYFCVNCGTKKHFTDEKEHWKGHWICGTTNLQRFLLAMNKELSGWVCSKECEKQLLPEAITLELREDKLTKIDKGLFARKLEDGGIEVTEIWPLPLEEIKIKE